MKMSSDGERVSDLRMEQRAVIRFLNYIKLKDIHARLVKLHGEKKNQMV